MLDRSLIKPIFILSFSIYLAVGTFLENSHVSDLSYILLIDSIEAESFAFS